MFSASAMGSRASYHSPSRGFITMSNQNSRFFGY